MGSSSIGVRETPKDIRLIRFPGKTPAAIVRRIQMAQIYAIYLRSNPMVHDVISTRRTAAEDFQQFFNPAPESYVDGRKRANPKLYTTMNNVDFHVLQPPSSWSQTNHANPVASWRSRPADVVNQIRSAAASQAIGGSSTVAAATQAAWSGKHSRTFPSARNMTDRDIESLDDDYCYRHDQLLGNARTEMQADYPEELVAALESLWGGPAGELSLTEDELLELWTICKFKQSQKDTIWRSSQIAAIEGLLAFHEQLRLKKGKS